ncbi:hypothetical protein [Caudoviricetes sp.]|nr:hypothetical protein [Caudoviricetes sp.]
MSEDGTYFTTNDADILDDPGEVIMDFNSVWSEDLTAELAEEALSELD